TLLPLWRKARRVSSAASRLPGTTSLRFALHGWQRMLAPMLFVPIPKRILLLGVGGGALARYFNH
ncbi:MAG: hypothetical protein JMN26_18150, partial [gamma proteobacterium endosymbiont of Lamellibrachia anaximandri]|nr:hypothetical protein [gamma proteobacterium endosymbiont of Lamellibrachia anaximandri]